MACGTPCIVTDVGDSSYIVGKTGWVVPPNNSHKLAEAIQKSLDEIRSLKWNKRCIKAQLRIKDKFNIGKMIELYNSVWVKVYKKD